MKFFKSLNLKKIISMFLILTCIFNFFVPSFFVYANTHTYEFHVPIVGDSGVGKTSIFEYFLTYGKVLEEKVNYARVDYVDKFGKTFRINFYDINIDLDTDVDKTNFKCEKLDKILPIKPDVSLIVLDTNDEKSVAERRVTFWKDVMKTKSPRSSIVFVPNKSDLPEARQEGEDIGNLCGRFELKKKYPCNHQDFASIPTSIYNKDWLLRLREHIFNVFDIMILRYDIKALEYLEQKENYSKLLLQQKIEEEKRRKEEIENELQAQAKNEESVKQYQTIINRLLRSEKIREALEEIIFPQKKQGFSKEQIENDLAEILKPNESWPPKTVQVSTSSSSSSSSETFAEGELINDVLNMQPIKNNLNQSVTQMLNNGYTIDEIEETILQRLNQGRCPREPWWKSLAKKVLAWFKP